MPKSQYLANHNNKIDLYNIKNIQISYKNIKDTNIESTVVPSLQKSTSYMLSGWSF